MSRNFWLLLLLISGFCPCVQAQTPWIERIQKIENSLVEIKTVYTKVMHIRGSKTASFERKGAGIIIDPSGLIVTNTHIIANAPRIVVLLHDGTKLEAQVVFISTGNDFSFLKIAPPHPLKAIQWADSSQVQLDKNIEAIGNSEQNHQSILDGKVIGVVKNKSGTKVELLELNLALYHGDSGGPVLDQQGRLLGMIMAKKKSEERSSFAIASDKLREQYLIYKNYAKP